MPANFSNAEDVSIINSPIQDIKRLSEIRPTAEDSIPTLARSPYASMVNALIADAKVEKPGDKHAGKS
ncbi:hypothetical protein LshimejAT787_1700990 [Lyophyllum shimeji]|uniref:Uncharacterized protein n=1 Tax=Lyophyllum shimeji TaxID=47721 RepID=A0A9P3UTS3_LYOSH|nr:hypothetical protein LshimejAT787_1700990 [Lyophyllum shimeji]